VAFITVSAHSGHGGSDPAYDTTPGITPTPARSAGRWLGRPGVPVAVGPHFKIVNEWLFDGGAFMLCR
jgi:hypothetical protein